MSFTSSILLCFRHLLTLTAQLENVRHDSLLDPDLRDTLCGRRRADKLTQPDRTKRVKEARTEAQREIDEYRKQKEDEFKKFEAEVRSELLA